MSEENLNFRREQLKAIPVSSNLSFTFRPVKAAPRNYVSQADMVLADIGVLEAGLSAEKEGFSAVCVDTMSDSGVSALRSVLSIPVVGPGRTSMLTALSLGNKFSIVTMWQKWKHFYMKTLTLQSIVSISELVPEPSSLFAFGSIFSLACPAS